MVCVLLCRDRLSQGMYATRDEDDADGVIEVTLDVALLADPIEAKIRAAKKPARVGAGSTAQAGQNALETGVNRADELVCLVWFDEPRD